MTSEFYGYDRSLQASTIYLSAFCGKLHWRLSFVMFVTLSDNFVITNAIRLTADFDFIWNFNVFSLMTLLLHITRGVTILLLINRFTILALFGLQLINIYDQLVIIIIVVLTTRKHVRHRILLFLFLNWFSLLYLAKFIFARIK